MRRPLAALIAVLLLWLSAGASSAAEQRFGGYVAGAGSGKGRDFMVGDGLKLMFIDRENAYTVYRVCWHRLHHSRHRCWAGQTARFGHWDRIFTAAPSSVGTYIVKWTVNNRRKAMWRFYNGPGD